MAWNKSDDGDAVGSLPRSSRHAGSKALPRGVMHGLMAGLIVAVGAGMVLWWFTRETSRTIEKEANNARLIPVANQNMQTATNRPDIGKSKIDSKTNDVEQVAEKTPEEIEREARAKDPLYDRHHIVAAKPLLKDSVEQLMYSVFSVELGDMPPMLPTIPEFDEKRFAKIAGELTTTEKDDEEEVVLAKGIVNQVKQELAKYLAEGGTVNSFLAHYVNELDSAFKERQMTTQMMLKAMKTEEPAVAKEIYKKYSERLADKGIKPIVLTKKQKEYLGISEENDNENH